MTVPHDLTEGVYLGIFLTKLLAESKERTLEGEATRNFQMQETAIIPRGGWTKGGSDATRVQSEDTGEAGTQQAQTVRTGAMEEQAVWQELELHERLSLLKIYLKQKEVEISTLLYSFLHASYLMPVNSWGYC